MIFITDNSKKNHEMDEIFSHIKQIIAEKEQSIRKKDVEAVADSQQESEQPIAEEKTNSNTEISETEKPPIFIDPPKLVTAEADRNFGEDISRMNKFPIEAISSLEEKEIIPTESEITKEIEDNASEPEDSVKKRLR